MRTLLFSIGLSLVLGQDTCSDCVDTATELQALWTNATNVQDILQSLEEECSTEFKFQPAKKKVCDDFMEVLVQVPPGIFKGLETLAWDIPMGICLTIGQCSALCCEPDAGPEQIHLSLPGFNRADGFNSRMGVSWVTLDGTSSVVQYQKADGSGEVFESTGSVTTYPDEQELAKNKTLWPSSEGSWVGTIHRAVMGAGANASLEPGTQYMYRVGSTGTSASSGSTSSSESEGLWSEWITFQTFPAADAFTSSSSSSSSSGSVGEKKKKKNKEGEELSLTFAIIGDMGYGNKSDATVENLASLVEAGELDGVVHTGDVGYADGYMPHWDVFLNKIEAIASRVPYMVVPGNHEIWYNFSAFKHRFMMPGVGPLGASSSDDQGDASGSGDGLFFEWGVPGLAHFAACDSETDLDTASFAHPFSDQVSWMSRVLAASNTPEARASEPWSVAHFHRPLYCSNDGECNQAFDDPTGGMASILRMQGESLFVDNDVDLVVSGHIHSYERSLPMVHGNATSATYDGPGLDPVYLVQGSSGNRESNPGFPEDPPAWSAARSSSIGFGLLTLSRSRLDFSFYAARSASEGGPELVDSFSMTK